MPPTDPRTGSSGSRPCQSPPPERLKAGRRWQGADEPGSRSERAKAPPHGARQRCAVDLRPRSRACRCRVDRRGRARQGGAGAASRGIGVRLRRRREMPLGPRAVSPLSPDRERAYSANNRSKVVLSTVKLGPPNSTKLDYRQYPSPEHTRHSFTSGEVSACFHFSGVMSNYAGAVAVRHRRETTLRRPQPPTVYSANEVRDNRYWQVTPAGISRVRVASASSMTIGAAWLRSVTSPLSPPYQPTRRKLEQ